MLVKEIMTKDVITVESGMSVHDLAELLILKNISACPVVCSEGELLGVVSEEGVLFQDKKVHLPSFFHILGGFITLGVKRFEDELKKITADSVNEIMQSEVKVLDPNMNVEDAATLMIENDQYYCPVVEENKLIGVVTKRDIVRAIARN